jgi:hypothetical protein
LWHCWEAHAIRSDFDSPEAREARSRLFSLGNPKIVLELGYCIQKQAIGGEGVLCLKS